MKKILMTLLIGFLIPSWMLAQDLIALTPDKGLTTDGREDCVQARITIPTPYVRSDCPDSDQYNVNFTFQFKPCFGIILNSFCDFAYTEIEVNGSLIKTLDLTETSTIYNETLTASDYAHLLGNASEACFTIRVYKNCTLTGISEVYSATKCIRVAKEGDQFSIDRIDGPITQEQLECIDDPDITVCPGDPSVTVSSMVAHNLSSSQTNAVNFSFGDITVGGNSVEVDFPISYVSSTNLVNFWTEGVSVLRELTITPEPGVCKSIALNINYLQQYTDYHSVGPCGESPMQYMSAITGQAIYNVTFHECVLFICPDKRPEIHFTQKIDNSRRSGDCTGSITASIPTEYIGQLEFQWYGPDGYTSTTQDLNDVALGAYTLVVTDDCGTEYQYSYFLCNNVGYGNWELDEENLIFCRSLVCNEEDCEVEGSQECVEPDEIIEVFENGNCIERFYYNGEYLGEISSAPELKIEFDEVQNKCIKIAKCKNEEYLIEEHAPTYGIWQFDYGLEQCYRSIYCFDVEVANTYDTKDPQIDEQYDLITGLCNRTAYCDPGVPINLSPKTPLSSNPWEWNEVQGCTKNVQCSIESGTETINGQESFTNWSYNSNTDLCESNVNCENIWVPGAIHSELPTSTGIWNWSSARPLAEQCYRTILCGGTTYIEESTQPTYQTTTTPCGDGLYVYYIICDGVNTFETGCGSFTSDDDDVDLRNVQKIDLDDNITVYPNPFTNKVFIEGLSAPIDHEVIIQNTIGQTVLKRKLEDNFLDLSTLSSGSYILKITNNNQPVKIQKIIKL